MQCDRAQTCSFYGNKMGLKPAVVELVKQTFCERDKNQCARYQLIVAGLPVPDDLYPSDINRGREIIRDWRSRAV
jgi:hypothetical protein